MIGDRLFDNDKNLLITNKFNLLNITNVPKQILLWYKYHILLNSDTSLPDLDDRGGALYALGEYTSNSPIPLRILGNF